MSCASTAPHCNSATVLSFTGERRARHRNRCSCRPIFRSRAVAGSDGATAKHFLPAQGPRRVPAQLTQLTGPAGDPAPPTQQAGPVPPAQQVRPLPDYGGGNQRLLLRPLEGFRRPGHNNLAGTTRQERFTVFDNRARPPLACPKEYILAILAGLLKQSYTPCQTHDGQIWDSSLRSPSPPSPKGQ